MEKGNTIATKILKSKWLGLGLTGVGVLQLLVVVGYLFLFGAHSRHNAFADLVTVVYSLIALVLFALFGLFISIKLAILYKSEEELGIAVFGIILNMLIVIAFFKLTFIL